LAGCVDGVAARGIWRHRRWPLTRCVDAVAAIIVWGHRCREFRFYLIQSRPRMPAIDGESPRAHRRAGSEWTFPLRGKRSRSSRPFALPRHHGSKSGAATARATLRTAGFEEADRMLPITSHKRGGSRDNSKRDSQDSSKERNSDSSERRSSDSSSPNANAVRDARSSDANDNNRRAPVDGWRAKIGLERQAIRLCASLRTPFE